MPGRFASINPVFALPLVVPCSCMALQRCRPLTMNAFTRDIWLAATTLSSPHLGPWLARLFWRSTTGKTRTSPLLEASLNTGKATHQVYFVTMTSMIHSGLLIFRFDPLPSWIYEPLSRVLGVYAAINGCSEEQSPAVNLTAFEGGLSNIVCTEFLNCKAAPARIIQCLYDGSHGVWPDQPLTDELMWWFFTRSHRPDPARRGHPHHVLSRETPTPP